MRVFDAPAIRNVALAGHSGAGKTQLASALLFTAGAVNRLGKVDEGTTVTDYDEEAIARKHTLGSSLAWLEWQNTKINLIDTPGVGNLLSDTRNALRVVEAVVIVVDGVSGVQVQTEAVWQAAADANLPRLVAVNRLDRERASFERTLESLREAFGRSVVPITLPVGAERGFQGVVDLLTMQALTYLPGRQRRGQGRADPGGARGRGRRGPRDAGRDGRRGRRRADGALLRRRHADQRGARRRPGPRRRRQQDLPRRGDLGADQRRRAAAARRAGPAGALPRRTAVPGGDQGGRADHHRRHRQRADARAFVWRTVADPFAGRITLFRVVTGHLVSDTTATNVTRGDAAERLGHLLRRPGQDAHPGAGSEGRRPRRRRQAEGDADRRHARRQGRPGRPSRRSSFPAPVLAYAIEPKTRGDEDKISSALHRLREEDPTIHFDRDPQTKDQLLSGQGQLHIEVTVAKLKRRFGVDVTLKLPRVPYRETIGAPAEAHGRHKKQTGGHGQFGDCRIRVEPLPRGADFEFVDEIFGGSIPRQFVPAVEKGIQDARMRGYLAGYPMVDFRVIVFDGSYHDGRLERAGVQDGRLAGLQGRDGARRGRRCSSR